MIFTTHGHTPQSFASAMKLETYEMEPLSGFLLACLRLEPEVLATFKAETDQATTWLLEQEGIHKPRIAKNHVQLLVAVMAMSKLMHSDDQFAAVRAQIVAMAQERQRAISADHPLVQELWEAFDYLDSIPKPTAHGPVNAPRLNHSRDKSLIAVNLNEFVEMASERRQQVPPLAELKKVLRTSKTRRFVDAARVVKSAIKTNSAGEDAGKTVRCWVFEVWG